MSGSQKVDNKRLSIESLPFLHFTYSFALLQVLF